MALQVKTIINNPVSSNCHIIYGDSEKHGIVVDPGSEDCSEILSFLKDNAIVVDYVILTHEHFDHTWSTDKFSAPVLCAKECADTICDKKRNLSFFFNQDGFQIEVNATCVEDYYMKMKILGFDVEFYKNKAHSPGGLLFVIDKYIVTGDMLIKDLKTVTKLQWANKEELPDCERWLREKHGNGYIVLAGHGENFELDNYDINKIY